MKKITSLSIVSVIVMAFGIVMFSSCSKDSTDACASVTCVNGNTVTSGTTCSCSCSDGYYGSSCSSAYNTLYVGIWNINGERSTQVDSTSNTFTTDYSDTIIAGSGAKVVIVGNFAAYLNNATLNVDTARLYQATGDTFRTSYLDGATTVNVKIYNFSGTLNTAHTQVQYTYGYNSNVGGGSGTSFTAAGTMIKQ